jgi:hypothetical protein
MSRDAITALDFQLERARQAQWAQELLELFEDLLLLQEPEYGCMRGILGGHISNLYSVRSQVGGLLGGGVLCMQECANHHQEYEKCLHPSLLVAR